MWPAKTQRLLVIGARRVDTALQVRGRLLVDSIAVRPLPPGAGLGDVLAAVEALWPLQEASPADEKQEVRILLSDSWLRWLSLPWSDGFLKADALARHCQLQFAAAWGAESMDCRFVIDDAPYGQPRLAAALEQPLLAGLQAIVRERKGFIGALRPLSIAGWQSVTTGRNQRNWILELREEHCVTLVSVKNGRPGLVFSQSGEQDAALQTDVLVRRLRLRDAQWDGDGDIRLMDAISPTVVSQTVSQTEEAELPAALQWAAEGQGTALDFVRQHIPLWGWRLGMVAAAVLMALTVAFHMSNATDKLARAEGRIAAQRRPAPPTPNATESRAEEVRLLAANKAIRKLNVPITKLLRAVQPPQDLRIGLLGIDLADAAQERPLLRINAEARTAADMAAYVGYLGDRRPFYRAYLMRHEVAGEGKDRPYRFTVEAAWQD